MLSRQSQVLDQLELEKESLELQSLEDVLPKQSSVEEKIGVHELASAAH